MFTERVLCMVFFASFRELQEGVAVFTESGERLGNSRRAANKAIPLVVISRILMATPAMSKARRWRGSSIVCCCHSNSCLVCCVVIVTHALCAVLS